MKTVTMYCCQNCAYQTLNAKDLRRIIAYNMRVDADGPQPDGECPECGSLCYEEAVPLTLAIAHKLSA